MIPRLVSIGHSITIVLMDAKKTISKLKGEAEKVSVTLYLSKSVYSEFRKAVHPVAASKVLDELMKDFLEDLGKSKATSGKLKKSTNKKN